MPIHLTLSATTARKLLHYDARTGELTWNVDRGSIKMGDEAGTVRPDKRVTVIVNGKTYLANRLIWLLQTGEHPKTRLAFKDGNPQNLRWSNIVPEEETLAQTKSAAYQRDLRRRRKRLIEAGSIPY